MSDLAARATAAVAAGAQSSRPGTRRLAWIEPAGGIAPTLWRDGLLTLLTAGLWLARAKVESRQRVWGAIHFDGAPFRYTGTVREHLMPMLAALAMLLLLAGAFLIMKAFAVPRPRVEPSPWRLLVSVPLVFLIGARLWRARAQLLARTLWRGLPGALHGSPWRFAGLHLGSAVALPLTLGWIAPWRQCEAMVRLASAAEIAGERLVVTPFRPLWGRFALTWSGIIAVYLAAVLTLAVTMGPTITRAVAARVLPALTGSEIAIVAGLSVAAALLVSALMAWHRIGGLRALASNTKLGGAPLRLEASTAAFVFLGVTHTAIKLASFGLLGPLAEARQIRFLISHLSLDPLRPA